ncbi:MAG: four helix bundle protein [Planctomycetaceae bacterium]|nr:four helix bundle protein [Planctomycetaceae bacterium]
MTNAEIPNDEGCPNAKARTENGHPEHKRPYDLEERTALFGENVIEYLKGIPVTPITKSLIDQLVRSATSIGANYCEADDSGTKKEFRHRISICKRESRESKHWLRMIAKAIPEKKESARHLWQEAKELNLIFSAIFRGRKKP